MLRGLYSAATGMEVQREKMNVLTNNISNVDTAGYKKDTLVSSSFADVLLERQSDPNVVNQFTEVGPYNFGTHVDEVVTDFAQGTPEETGKNTDLALAGDGFFVVQTAAGERYTRDGSFTVDADGYLVTGDGDYVQGSRGRIQVGDGEFQVSGTGAVTAGGKTVDTLRLVRFADSGSLRKQGGSLYDAGGGAAESADCRVLQGYRETSNVSVADEMVNMMSVYRAYEANQKILTMTDQTLGLAVNDLGSLR